MSLQEQQNLLAKLYTDAEFRRAFLSAPDEIGAANNLTSQEIVEIAEIMPEELDFFADSLFWKRLREVEKFLPLLKKALGDDFTKYFRRFSQNFNPQSVKKHFEDALGFAGFLKDQTFESRWINDLAKFEHSRMSFNAGTKTLVLARFDYDIREIIREIAANDSELKFAPKKTVAVWLKIRKRTIHIVR